jgi:hypothetical protein
MVLVEQNISFGLRLADTAHLMQSGVVAFTGPVAELDQERLAEHLGVGRMLSASTGSALATRRPAGRRRTSTPKPAQKGRR